MRQLNFPVKVLLATLVVLLCLAPVASAAEAEGSCGADLTWSLSAGTLVITGSGAMDDYEEDNLPPWYDYREEIARLQLPEGLTSVGNLAFYGCSNLVAVNLPDSVERVGDFAFMDCSGMKLLDLGSVEYIGEAAFSDCYSLTSLTLPDTLRRIDLKGFYRCESLTTVTIPANVQRMGTSVFAYCKNLVKATIETDAALPDWLFYKCEKLSQIIMTETVEDIAPDAFRACGQLETIYYDGDESTVKDLLEIFNSEETNPEKEVTVQDPASGGGAASGSAFVPGENGQIKTETVTTQEKDKASVSTVTQTTYAPDTFENLGTSSRVDLIVDGEDSWNAAGELLQGALTETAGQNPEVNFYLKNTDGVSQKFLETMAGQPVQATVTTQSGSSWVLDFTNIGKAKGHDLSYSVSIGSEEVCTELGVESVFALTFENSVKINAEVLIYLGQEYAWSTATLVQRDQDGLTRLQSVLVDGNGYAHFYLASVSSNTEYFIAMNLEGADSEAILPASALASQNGISYEPIQYKVTGRTSSWNMNIGQVSGIMIGVLIVCFVVVGLVMYTLNRRKLLMGYVPNLEDEEES